MALGVNSASDSLGILINGEKYCCNIKKKQDQGASVQKTVWTVNRCVNGGILSPALVVVCVSGLYCAVLAQGCIFRLTCSHPELTQDPVPTSAYVKIFRTVTRNAINKSV